MITLNDILDKSNKSDTGFSQHYLLLYSIIRSMECENVLEFGHGYSTQVILSALNENNTHLYKNCKVTTIDIRTEPDISQDRYKNTWKFVSGNSLDVFKKIEHPYYDVILHDGSHYANEVEQDLKNCLPYLKYNGLLLVHDTNHPTLKGQMQLGVKNALKGRKFEHITLPFGYGLTIICWKENKDNKVTLQWSKK